MPNTLATHYPVHLPCNLQILYIYTSIPIKEQCVFVSLFVLFLSATRDFLLCGAASEYSESSQAVAGGPARAGKRMHRESTRAHALQLLNEKIAALMHFKNKTVRARWSEPTLVSSCTYKRERVCVRHCAAQISPRFLPACFPLPTSRPVLPHHFRIRSTYTAHSVDVVTH